MDSELPRNDYSINNRAQLAKEIHISNLMKRNKEQDEPLRSMVEIMTKFFLEKHNKNNSSVPMNSSSTASLPASNGGAGKTSALYDHSEFAFSGLPPEDVSGKKAAKATVIHMPAQRPSSRFDDENEDDTRPGQSDLHSNSKKEVSSQKISRPSNSRRRGMSGPITSNLDDKSRKNKKKPSANLSGNSSLTFENDITSEYSNHIIDDYTDTKTHKTETKHSTTDSFQDLLHAANIRSSKLKEKKRNEKDTKSKEENQEIRRSRDLDERTSQERPQSQSGRRRKSSTKQALEKSTTLGDVEFGDVDDVDDGIKDHTGSKTVPYGLQTKVNFNSKPITLKQAMEIKNLIFGTSQSAFNDEWRAQGFGFSNTSHLEYGIVQHKGGPCGVLASVQACMIRQLLFGEGKLASPASLQPLTSERSHCLAGGLADIFWRAGSRKSATVCLSSGRPVFTAGARYKSDNLTETLNLNSFSSYEDLYNFLKANIGAFEGQNSPGVILSLYSVIFSRTVDKIIVDMDEPTNKLMGAHGYCTQEMVNLYLAGEAVSNVFNDIMELDSGGSEKMLLKGLSGRSDVGLLSLFEHYKSCEVGRYYKTPKYPIWVVCSESHFSVLFCIKKELVSDWRVERRFDLYYYDGLARQDEEIRLTIDTTQVNPTLPSEDDLVPPLELCIRTKWPDAVVSWNGSEPIL
ncbi:probable ubiquitin carboxyl-terminal hydrolase MINDY-4 isoform X2 [Anneissia japonica]|nr:probable ubiquitin carboxyl-terminal hydrolase MINDY-4 isoform X2 [Anneissia japonica]XP_033127194.1 probable ubiquitin carboxyl-terminal hydrolase MINDY-4 isoform X2 [Anneissia japonica]